MAERNKNRSSDGPVRPSVEGGSLLGQDEDAVFLERPSRLMKFPEYLLTLGLYDV